MDQVSLNQTINPFSNLTDFLCALDIIKRTYSIKTHNIDDVTRNINEILKTSFNSSGIQKFIGQVTFHAKHYGYEFFASYEHFQKNCLLSSLNNDYHNKVLTPRITACVFCATDTLEIRQTRLNKDPILFSLDSIAKCVVNTKICSACQAIHYFSYALNTKTSQKHFYTEADQNDFFQFSSETLFETKLLLNFTNLVIFSHVSFIGFCSSYNILHCNVSNNNNLHRFEMNEKRLADAFFSLHLVKYFNEFLKCPLICNTDSNDDKISPLDEVIFRIKNFLLPNFVRKWSAHLHNDQAKCNLTITLDGLWKTSRTKCCFDELYIKTDFGDIKIGCPRTPLPHSYYCKEHQDCSLSFYVDGIKKKFKPSDIVATRMHNLRNSSLQITKVYDSHIDDEEIELFLCRTNSSSNNLLWFENRDIPKELIQSYKDSKAEHVHRDKFTSCDTDKASKFYTCFYKIRTRGIILAASNCGIIIGFTEIFGAESLTQVAQFYLDICDHFSGAIPAYLIYDNACNLKAFALNEKNRIKQASVVGKQSRTVILDHIHYVVDRLHIKGHKDENCILHCHPDNFPQLTGVNTMVCEQKNSWASKYKFAANKMNWLRFNFFFVIIFDLYNTININKPKAFNHFFRPRGRVPTMHTGS